MLVCQKLYNVIAFVGYDYKTILKYKVLSAQAFNSDFVSTLSRGLPIYVLSHLKVRKFNVCTVYFFYLVLLFFLC